MDCPRCGETLGVYVLSDLTDPSDREAVACETCGYLGVAVEHRSEPVEVESWDEALERFRKRRH